MLPTAFTWFVLTVVGPELACVADGPLMPLILCLGVEGPVCGDVIRVTPMAGKLPSFPSWRDSSTPIVRPRCAEYISELGLRVLLGEQTRALLAQRLSKSAGGLPPPCDPVVRNFAPQALFESLLDAFAMENQSGGADRQHAQAPRLHVTHLVRLQPGRTTGVLSCGAPACERRYALRDRRGDWQVFVDSNRSEKGCQLGPQRTELDHRTAVLQAQVLAAECVQVQQLDERLLRPGLSYMRLGDAWPLWQLQSVGRRLEDATRAFRYRFAAW